MISFEKYVAAAIKHEAQYMSGFFWIGAVADITLAEAQQHADRMVALGLAKFVDREKKYLELVAGAVDRWKRRSA